jgi:hypothetical protein
MKKLIFVVICFALVFAGYRAEVGTGSVARGSSEGSDARAISDGPRMGIPGRPIDTGKTVQRRMHKYL